MAPHAGSSAAASAAAAAVALACVAYYATYDSAAFTKAWRWLLRNLASSSTADTGPANLLEPGEQAWPGSCRPLTSVSELLTWQPSSSSSPGPPAPQPARLVLPTSSSSSSSAAEASTSQRRPQLLVCHDMMGGYLEEEVAAAAVSDAGRFRLWHWDAVDSFVYFTHHLVSVPPPGWVHAAHKHGVKVLGTFITEFGQGRQRCARLFDSHAAARRVADQLVALASHHGFEGWLVNIENPLSEQQVAVMAHFVGYLRARMQDTVGQHSTVVWYDAVTTAGKLQWQNGLTRLNGPFFDLADALFVNYTWTPASLAGTTAAAGRRAHAVYMGVDVHGRGSYGGGGWGVRAALSAAVSSGLSAALFAPGWVFENLDRQQFHALQDVWWAEVQSSWGLSHPVVTQLPFSTSFIAGAGRTWFSAGTPAADSSAALAAAAGGGGHSSSSAAVESGDGSSSSSSSSSSGWFNMMATDTLPCLRDPVSQQVLSSGGPLQGAVCCATAFEGGSSLVLFTQQQQQQQQQQTEAASLAPAASCPLVLPPVSSSDAGRQLSLAQLFTADVHVGGQEAFVSLRCVYAAPVCSSSSSGAGAHYAGPPTLWLMTQQQPSAAAEASTQDATLHLPVVAGSQLEARTSSGGSGGGASDASSNGSSSGSTVIVGTAAVAEDSGAAAAGSGSDGVATSVLLLPDGSPSHVSVQFVATTASSSSSSASLAQVVLVNPDQSGVSADVPAAAPASSSSDVPALPALSFMSALPEAVGGWVWQRAAWEVPVCAGCRITGLGVALPLCSDGGSRSSGSGVGVAGILGRLEVRLLRPRATTKGCSLSE